MRYPVPDLALESRHSESLEVEKSRFIAWIAHTPTPDDLDTLLAAARQEHPTARHHCTAFIAGPPGEQHAIGFSDDGEPGGTAGRPMFQVLDGSGLGEIGCVVIRYFGGIKLGTGGLARAYAQTVSNALATLPTRNVIERDGYRLPLDFAQEALARAWCAEHDIPVTAADYDGQGVCLTLAWPRDVAVDAASLESRLKTSVTLQAVEANNTA
ncbi:IMPACT family protein [Vreelandella jeotgali]|uniref:IMPACT family protein n=1 Tax=Vreelandella jeotgali TaxID=553386 RepID=UPI00034B1AE0|nr:YigZ family protein [Halomonas jeotgali]